ncbi:MAG: hypothetical protein IPM74_06010 [Crocinitomicaceae bacterium]|nr:hypothetical protein [Crocinitomicaceae bacterium]MBK8925458.1 hypothetical protein [Crocinitomicaceae bacterium]
MKNFIFPLLVIVLSACQTNSNTEQTEQEILVTEEKTTCENMTDAALNFMNDYVDYCLNPQPETGLTAWIDQRKDVTTHFKDELNTILREAIENDPEMGLGFDPLLNAQDCPEKGFELFSCDSTSKLVEVSGIDYPEFKVNISLLQENNIWKIEGCGVVNIF